MVLLLDDTIKIVYEFSEEVGEVMFVRLGEICGIHILTEVLYE